MDEKPEVLTKNALDRKVTFKKKTGTFTGKTSLKDRAEDVKLLLVKSRTKQAKDLDPEEQLCSFSDPSVEPDSVVRMEEPHIKDEVEGKEAANAAYPTKLALQKQVKGFVQRQTDSIALEDVPLPTMSQL